MVLRSDAMALSVRMTSGKTVSSKAAAAMKPQRQQQHAQWFFHALPVGGFAYARGRL
jgi:hypothetical protein